MFALIVLFACSLIILAYLYTELQNERELHTITSRLGEDREYKLREKLDVLHDMVCDVYNDCYDLEDLANEKQMDVFFEIDEAKGRKP